MTILKLTMKGSILGFLAGLLLAVTFYEVAYRINRPKPIIRMADPVRLRPFGL